jgi:DNA-binding transcriptional regulator YhcF (GntR family)
MLERSNGEEKLAITARSLADDTGLHRVTVQRSIDELRRQGIVTRDGQAIIFHWDVLALVHRPKVPQTQDDNRG